nr:immunoglobulin heavy chain junction region [Macaca mulatta]MOW23287.1 immunoglobulin heavy chain junction region [Macaca mulatta]MOW23407.1 immunoglobulin heavy chain junction region [Macaca mulatta]MOW23585.1 immunoglobulin heavy chain junction region [Macaca mulatta]MOW23683.1 immunoglobulin heavy chain junction region [Macaca mulatta]
CARGGIQWVHLYYFDYW